MLSCLRSRSAQRASAWPSSTVRRAIRGVSRTEFLLRSSEAAAIEVLNERPVIALDDGAWDDFVAALDAPVELDPAVKARYARRPQWDR